MSYIILNNKNSNTIGGLIIQSLPPIIKPRKKTLIEEIDGVDGDIITDLGYSAYDKELTIGLSYNYNIDEVIEYFNSEGTVVFSNEPNKVYKYKIYEQIDFNALLRFKNAVVKFHVQPYKYSLNEEEIDNTNLEDIIINYGNEISKPKITIYGENDIDMYLNDKQVFKVKLGEEEYITIDSENMEAYKDTTNTLKNRLVIGNYDDCRLNKGENTIRFVGNVTRHIISNYSRWI